MKIQKLLEALNELLEPEKFRDYCPNGLQIQGKKEVKDIVCGVSASEALINEAVKRGADTIIVHHGYFWKNENPRITGLRSFLSTILTSLPITYLLMPMKR